MDILDGLDQDDMVLYDESEKLDSKDFVQEETVENENENLSNECKTLLQNIVNSAKSESGETPEDEKR